MIIQEPIKILQLSDFHLFAKKEQTLAGICSYDTLHAVIEKVKKNLPAFTPDLVAITGDIAQDHTLSAYNLAQELLKTLAYPMVAIPGNHEDIAIFFEVFVKPMLPVKKLVLGNWQLLFLNSHQPNVVEGFLSQEELIFLNNALLADQNKFTLIFVHHHVLPVGCKWLDKLNLKNSAEFLETISLYDNIKAVISGHVHQNDTQIKNKISFITSPSTCFQFSKHSVPFHLDKLMPGFRCFNLHENGHFTTEVIRVDEDPRFIPDTTVRGY